MTKLKSPPVFISSRLMAAVSIGGAEVSVGPTGRTDRDGKPVWNWIVELEDGETFSGSDLAGYDDHNGMLGTLLAFLGAFAEARRPDSDNRSLFPDGLRAWAEENSDEIGMTRLEIEE